jgi:putative peptidoglycan lipid II flippase
MWPGGGEDATQLIQRISDAGLNETTVPYLPVIPAQPERERVAVAAGSADAGPGTSGQGPSGPAAGSSAVAGMRTARTGGVVRAGALMAVATLVSRATGFLAKVILLATLGVGMVNDAYTIANTLPNIIFELLIGGVLTSVAIPLLSRARSDPDGGQGYTQRLVTMAAVGLIGATGLAIAAAPLLTHLYLSGHDSTSDPALATRLAYLLLPQVFFYGMAALFGAILNTKEKFGVPAWAPVVNNLVVIAVAVLLVRLPGGVLDPDGTLDTSQLLLLGVGTTAGIVLQAVVMVPALLRSGFRFRWRWGGDRRLLEAGRLMLWAVAYVLVSQIGYVVVTRVASGGIAGGITVYAFTLLLFQLPYGILGVSVLTAIMPRMSRHAAAGDMAGVKSDMSLANRLSAVALLPVAAAMVALAGPLAYLTSRYGSVQAADSAMIGQTLAALAVGLLPLAMTLVQMRVFYAMKDGRTPTLINAIMVAVRVPLLILCTQLDDAYLVPGLAAATTVSYLVGAVVGEIWLRARYGPMGTGRTLATVGKMTLASAAGGVAGYYAVIALFDPGIDNFGDALLELLAGAVVGLVVIALLATLLGVEELVPVRRRIAGFLGLGGRGAGAASPATPTGADARQETEPAARPDSAVLAGHGTLDAAASAPAIVSAAGTVPAPAPPVIVRPRAQVEAPVSVENGPPPGGGQSGLPAASGDRTGPDEATMLVEGGLTRQTSVATDFAPGQTVGGRYRLVSLIATDSHGNRFWRAKDTVLPRDMAVTLLPGGSSTSATVARTLRAGRLHHIGLPQTLDVGTDHGQSYVVGQWVDGATLTDLLAQGPLEPNVATSITAKISEAVAEAHRNGIALGAIHPSLVRVNFDGQVRLSHVIAHGSAPPDQDIRAVGGLLYLMLTGTWPLPESGDDKLPPAPTRSGREVPVSDLRPAVPAALSALATRALHPDEPDGIHAVGAIASLLRQPDAVPAAPARTPAAQPARTVRLLTPAEKRLVKERRAKLTVAAVMLAAFTALIIIVVASLTKQFMNSVADPASDGLAPISTSARTTSTAPLSTGTAPNKSTASSGSVTSSRASSSPSSTAVVAAPVKIVGGAVYDPQGDGNKDYEDLVDRAYDGDPTTQWLTFPYFQQFGPNGLKEGVGLLLELEKPITVSTVQVTTSMPGITVQIRSIPTGDVNTPLDQTQVIGSATIAGTDPVTVPTSGATKSKYICVFVSQAVQVDGRWQGALSEISVTGS